MADKRRPQPIEVQKKVAFLITDDAPRRILGHEATFTDFTARLGIARKTLYDQVYKAEVIQPKQQSILASKLEFSLAWPEWSSGDADKFKSRYLKEHPPITAKVVPDFPSRIQENELSNPDVNQRAVSGSEKNTSGEGHIPQNQSHTVEDLWTMTGGEAAAWTKSWLGGSKRIQSWIVSVDDNASREEDLAEICERLNGVKQNLTAHHFFLVRGSLGLGKSILLCRYLETCDPNRSCRIDMGRLLHDNCLQPAEIGNRVQTSLNTLATDSSNKCAIVIDGLDGAVRKIARQDGSDEELVLDRVFTVVRSRIRALRSPALVVLVGDDKCDGDDLPLVSTLAGMLDKPSTTLRLRLREDEDDWAISGNGVRGFHKEETHKKLALFLDAYEMHNGALIHDLLELLQERASQYAAAVSALRAAPPRHVLYDTAEAIIRWTRHVEHFDRKDPKSIGLCIDPIRGEQAWEWLYLVRIAYADKDHFVTRLWELHDLISNGLFQDTLALSNIISLLAYWNKFGQRPFQYIHCNLRGVLLSNLSQLEFYASDLTQAKTHDNPQLCGAKFVCCLFEKETLEWLEKLQACNLAASCYIERLEDGVVVKKLRTHDASQP